MQFDEIKIGDVIIVRYTAAHTGDKIHEITGTVKRKFKNSVHLVNDTNVNGSYELIKRTQIVEVTR